MSLLITTNENQTDYDEFEDFVACLTKQRQTNIMFSVIYNNQGYTDHEQTVMLDILFRQGVSIESTNMDGETCLHLSIWRRNHNLTYWLIQNGAYLEARDNQGRTPLHRAIKSDQYLIVCTLLNAGADVNAVVADTWLTPLHLALEHASDAVVFRILEHPKCCRTVANRQGQWPIELCAAARPKLLRFFTIF